LEAAARELTSNALPIRSVTEVAAALGAKSVWHFSRAFREPFRATPRESRRSAHSPATLARGVSPGRSLAWHPPEAPLSARTSAGLGRSALYLVDQKQCRLRREPPFRLCHAPRQYRTGMLREGNTMTLQATSSNWRREGGGMRGRTAPATRRNVRNDRTAPAAGGVGVRA